MAASMTIFMASSIETLVSRYRGAIISPLNSKKSLCTTGSRINGRSHDFPDQQLMPDLLDANQPQVEKKSELIHSRKCIKLQEWWDEHGCSLNGASVFIGVGSEGRTILANDRIPKDTAFLKLHRNFLLTPDLLSENILSLLPSTVTDWGKLSILLIIYEREQVSLWEPYVQALPAKGSFHSPMFWTAEEKTLLPKYLSEAADKRYQMIQTEYLEVKEALKRTKEYKDMNFLEEDFVHAYFNVSSRAWKIENLNCLAMVPFIDMANHDCNSSSHLIYDEVLENVEVHSDREYFPGDEIYINYGELGNSELLLDFGFVLPSNAANEVEIDLGVDENDPLRNEKLNALRNHGLLEEHKHKAMFSLKKVGSPAGRGRGIPHTLRAFARVLSASSEYELERLGEEASRNEGRLGRRVIRSGSREADSMEILLCAAERERGKLSTLLQEISGKEQASNGQSNVRWEMAREFCLGQIQVLDSVVSWLRPRSMGGGLEDILFRD